MRKRFEGPSIALAMAILLASGTSAQAQTTPAAPPADQDAATEGAESDRDQQEIIVTGVTANTRKQDATFSINTITAQDIQKLAPNGTAELLGNIPGFFPEGGSAGETHNNVLVRGLPQAGGYRYVPNLIDGLPAYEEPEAPFMNNDVFIKTDLMTQQIEAVKGGPGGILYSNALGAAINYITRTGTQEFEGAAKLEVGDWGYYRVDAYLSGPINKNLTFAVGGFVRLADGIRDPGFTADKGGQIRANLRYTSDDEATQVTLYGHAIRDKTIFYQNIPFALTSAQAPGTVADPFRIDPGSVRSLGVDFLRGTTLSPQTSYYDLYDAKGGNLTLDISDGINPEFNILTLDLSHKFGDGWRLGGRVRYTSGFNGFNAMFQDPPLERDVLTAQQFSRIQSLGGPLGAAYATAVGVKAYYTDTVTGPDLTTATEAPGILAHNIPVYARVDAENITVDVQLGKKLDLGWSAHDITLGGYTSYYTYDVLSVFASGFGSIEDRPRLVDLYAVNAAGQQVGPSITRGGLDQPGIFGLGASSKQRTEALYLLDHMEFFDSRLKVDAGLRWQRLKVDRVVTNSGNPGNTSNDFTPNGIVVGSTADTLADNFVNVPDGAPLFAEESYHGFGWSLGANYSLSDNIAVYGTIADSFRLPGFEDYVFGGPATNASTGEIARGDQVESIRQYEGGFRVNTRELNLSLAGFYIDFKAKETLGSTLPDLSATGAGGVSCSAVPTPANCPSIRDRYRRSLKNHGVELEASYRPGWLHGFELQGSIVWQDPKQGQTVPIRNAVEQFDSNGDGINDSARYVISTTQDRRPRRQPEWLINLRPSYRFSAIPLTLYGQMLFYSERFSDDGDANVTIYPAYTQFNAGMLVDVSEKLAFQLHVTNLNNAASFTEGTSISNGLRFTNGDYYGVARPLLGRTVRGSLTFRF